MNISPVKKTKDGFDVQSFDMVYEIMWSRLNQEVSIAYPEQRMVNQIPDGVNIWKWRIYCQQVCNKLNEKQKLNSFSMEQGLIKTIAG